MNNIESVKNRRKASRLDVPINLKYRIKEEDKNIQSTAYLIDALIKDISYNGCLLLTNETLPLNTAIELLIPSVQFECETINVEGQIIRTNNKNEYGISFKPLQKENIKSFGDIFFYNMYKKVGLEKNIYASLAPIC
ncbi:PilZ domain-containing protein [Candidatus Desantisbacteria bacterium]|nr:PilZ domain-containing protein [Candidatus Desantisbacteria bacterium]